MKGKGMTLDAIVARVISSITEWITGKKTGRIQFTVDILCGYINSIETVTTIRENGGEAKRKK